MTHVFATDTSGVTVWDTAGNIVWGPSQSPDPAPVDELYPTTADPMIQRLRPAVDDLQTVLTVDPSDPDAFDSISAAFSAITSARAGQMLNGGIGPQDFTLVRVAPGDYEERLRPPDWTALVSTTGDPGDVRVWWDFEVGPVHGPVLNPTGPCYIEGIHFDGIGHYEGDPGAGNAPATIWLINGALAATVTLVNVRSTSNNEWLNTGAWQAGDLSNVTAYRCTFEMQKGSQPVNAQTSQAWRSMNPAHRSDYIHIDCEAKGEDDLVVGVADLGYGAHDRFIWTGGTIHSNELTRAQFFNASINIANGPDNPYNCVSYCTPQVTFAGEGEHYWGEPADLDASLPTAGVAPGSRAYYYPQALDRVGEIDPAAADTTLAMEPGRHYYVPVSLDEARTLAGFSLDIIEGAGGVLSAQLWGGRLRDATFHQTGRMVEPSTWMFVSSSTSIVPGMVNLGRGTYKHTRLYPGEQYWIRLTADTACTISASSSLSAGGLSFIQDPADPKPVPETETAMPAPVLRTGIV